MIESKFSKIAVGLWTAELYTLLFDLRWALLLVFLLIIVDYWFGVKWAHKQRSELRWSRSWRRSLGKCVDYLCFILVGSLLGSAIGEPLGWFTHTEAAALMAVVAALCEGNSIMGHFMRLRGLRINTWGLLTDLLRVKHKGIGEALRTNVRKEEEDAKD